MKVFVPRILSSLLVCLAVVHTVDAQDTLGVADQPGVSSVPGPMPSPPYISDAPGQAVVGNYFGYTEVHRAFEPLIRVDSRTSALYGSRDGYTRISAFMPKWLDNESLIFVDAGGFASYNPSGGGNIGVGWRGYFEDFDRILGLSGWFDVDGANQRTYQQFGLSFESLGRYFDLRANGYVPVGDISHKLREVVSGPAFFYTNNIMLNRLTWREAVYTGFDAEIGGPTPILGRYGLSAYAGFYYFNSANVGGFTGVSGRIQGQINENWTLGAQVTHDHVFDTNAQIQVTLTLPDGKSGRWLRQLPVRDRMTQQVFRNYRTVVNEDFIVKAEQALNPADNQPFFVVHVDPNQAAGTGNGTFENPYAELAQFDNLPFDPKTNVDIIYVRPNIDGSSTNLDDGVTLLNNQRLLSTAVDHVFTATQGTFDLPGRVPTDLLPRLTNGTGGDVVTFATGNQNIEVSGFDISGSATGNGIAGLNNSRININRNTIHDSLNGIFLRDLNGTGDNRSLITGNTLENNFSDGARFSNSNGSTVEVVITDNTATGNGSNGVEFLASNNSNVTVVATSNDLSENDLNGFSFFADSGLHSVTVGGSTAELGNTFTRNGLDGIFVALDGTATASFLADNNVMVGNGEGATGPVTNFDIEVIFNGGLSATQQAIFALAAAKWESIIVGDIPDVGPIDDVRISAEGVAIDGAGGILGQAGPTSLRPSTFLPSEGIMQFDTADLTDLEAVGQLDEVILHEMGHVLGFGTIWTNKGLLTGAGGADPQFTGTNAVAEFNARFAATGTSVPVEGTPAGPGTADAHWRESIFINELMTGFIDSGVANPISRVTVGQFQDLGYQVNYNSADPFLHAGNNLNVDVGQVNRPIAVVGGVPAVLPSAVGDLNIGIGDGIHIVTSGTSVLNPAVIQNNTISLMGRHGINVEAAGNSDIPNLQILNNILDQNGTGTTGSGIRLTREDSANLDALISGNESTRNLAHGLEVQTTGTLLPDMVLTITGNEFVENSIDGIFISAGHTVIVNPSDNTITVNANDGVEYRAEGNGVLTVVSNGETITGNLGDNLQLSAIDNAVLNATFNNATVQNAGANGVNIFGADDGTLNIVFDSPAASPRTTIQNNGTNGLAANITQRSFLNLSVTDALIQNNLADGMNLRRNDASLILASVIDTGVLGNGDDGIDFTVSGSPGTDPNQPNSPTINRLTLLNSALNGNGIATSENGGNGLQTTLFADAQLVVDATLTHFCDNAADGVRVFGGDGSSFGTAASRSTFNAVTVAGNGLDGMRFFAMGNNSIKPTMFIDVNSNSGNTIISDNGDDGIEATVPYGSIDLLVRGDNVGIVDFATKIQRNGDNGIEFNVSDIALDGDDAGSANDILNFFFPNQYEHTNFDEFNGQGFLAMDNVIVGDENPNDFASNGNTNHGIEVYNSNSDRFTQAVVAAFNGPTPFFIIERAGFIDIDINNSRIAGNGGDGIHVQSEGGHRVEAPGNLVNLDVTNSFIGDNVGTGIDLQFNGRHGDNIIFGRGRGLRSNEIELSGNTIEGNGRFGVRLETNAGEQLRFNLWSTASARTNHYGVEFDDDSVAPGTATAFNPFNVGNTILFGGDNIYNSAPSYSNIATDSNTNFRFYSNIVQFNGTPESITADGLSIRVSTDSYVSADIGGAFGSGLGNTFTGNVGADVKIASFTATDANGNIIQPGGSSSGDTAGGNVGDRIFLDDTAQLDLRFANNSGSKVDSQYFAVIGPVGTAGLRGAFYDNIDSLKGSPGGQIRQAQIFQVDDGLNLNAINNWNAQNLSNRFGNDGSYRLRTIADPLFPNPAFPENFLTDPGDPWLQ